MEGIFIGYAETAKGYRIWSSKDRRVIVARDVKFLDKFDADRGCEDLTRNTSIGSGKIDPGKETYSRNQPAEIASNDRSFIHQPPGEPADDSIDVTSKRREDDVGPLNDEGTDIHEESHPGRGPGRPPKILTGKLGRPAKQYHLRSATSQPNPSTTIEQDPESEDENEADSTWSDAQFILTASEIPFLQAVSGPN